MHMGVILKFKFLNEKVNREFEEQLRAARTEYEQHCIAFISKTLELRCSDAANTEPVGKHKAAIATVRIEDDHFHGLRLNEEAVESLQKECSARFARTLCDILLTYVSGDPGYLTPDTSKEIDDHARHWAEQDVNLFTQMLLGSFDIDLDSKVRHTLTFRLKKVIGEAIGASYWHELAVPFIQAIPSLQAGVWCDEDRADEVVEHSGTHVGTDALSETEADGLIDGASSSERDGVASPVQADEGVQEVGGYYSVAALAQKHGVPPEALDQRLRRFRNKNAFGCQYIKNTNPAKRKTDPSYVYFEPTIMHHISELKKRQEANRKQREMLQFSDP